MVAILSIKRKDIRRDQARKEPKRDEEISFFSKTFKLASAVTFISCFTSAFIGFSNYLSMDFKDHSLHISDLSSKLNNIIVLDANTSTPQEEASGTLEKLDSTVETYQSQKITTDSKLRQMIVSIENISVYSSMKKDAKIKLTLYEGQVMLASKINNSWVKLLEGGFVQSKHLTMAYTVNLESNRLRVRSKPHLNAGVIAGLDHGSVVYAKILANGWAKIGPSEYVHSKFLRPQYLSPFGS